MYDASSCAEDGQTPETGPPRAGTTSRPARRRNSGGLALAMAVLAPNHASEFSAGSSPAERSPPLEEQREHLLEVLSRELLVLPPALERVREIFAHSTIL